MRALRLHEADSVAVALMGLARGDAVEGVVARDAIPRGHKIALRDIHAGEAVLKLGHTIGVAGVDVEAGAHVHTHNLRFTPVAATQALPNAARATRAPRGATFEGYRRADGLVGTRNMLLVLSTVNCSATVTRRIADCLGPYQRRALLPPSRQQGHRQRARPPHHGRLARSRDRVSQQPGMAVQPGDPHSVCRAHGGRAGAPHHHPRAPCPDEQQAEAGVFMTNMMCKPS
jgi:hypothetical protein